jgi:hypothetical protein
VVIGEPEPKGMPVSIKKQGEITKNAPVEDDDDESDLPTTVMPFGSSLAQEIRQAVAAQYDAPAQGQPAAKPPLHPAASTPAAPPPSADSLRAAAAARAPAKEEKRSIGMLQLVIGIACVAAVMTIAFSLAT